VATDLQPAAAPDATRQRRRGWIVLAIGVWNLWVWVTRLYNLATDDAAQQTFAFNAVHAALYGGSIVLALVLVVIGWRMRAEASA
jgi:hypothetical protein